MVRRERTKLPLRVVYRRPTLVLAATGRTRIDRQVRRHSFPTDATTIRPAPTCPAWVRIRSVRTALILRGWNAVFVLAARHDSVGTRATCGARLALPTSQGASRA